MRLEKMVRLEHWAAVGPNINVPEFTAELERVAADCARDSVVC